SPAWVSWREGDGSCSCVGWAPLPPEARCTPGIGCGKWIDYTCGLGASSYTFCHMKDFGSKNISTVCYSPQQVTNIFNHTKNCTNISYGKGSIYCGGPNLSRCSGEISKAGGRQVPNIIVDRFNKGQGL